MWHTVPSIVLPLPSLFFFCPENQTTKGCGLSLVWLPQQRATTLTALLLTRPPWQLLGEIFDRTEGSTPRCAQSDLSVGCCQNSPSCSGQLCWSPLRTARAAERWVELSGWCDGKPASSENGFGPIELAGSNLTRDVLKSSSIFWAAVCGKIWLSVTWGWILASFKWSLRLKHALDLYSSTSCVHANFSWEEREHFWPPSCCLCNQYPPFSTVYML